jgi:hypothetical protein
MSGQTWRTGAGERFEDIAAEDGRGLSDLRLMQWLLTGTARAAVSSNGADERVPAPLSVVDRVEREAVATTGLRRQRRRVTRGAIATPPRSFGRAEDRAGTWLRFAGVAVGLLAAAAAAVSYEAQWRLVYQDKHEIDVSYIQAAIPDLGSLVFACFGIALALHGRRAIRARLLNLLCVGISLAMNAFAAAPGWRDLAIWVMPSAVYALASDTLIGVIRAYVIARQKQLREALADDDITLVHIVRAVLLWLLRLALAPLSTLKGFHGWVRSLPAAPPLREAAEVDRPEEVKGPKRERPAIASQRGPRGGTKQEQFLTLVIARYGPLTEFDIKAVARAAAELAPEAELHPGTARKILRAQVLAAQNGDPQ